jgi:predicted solute-binding protein
MQVSFSRTGGFAPMPIGCRLNTQELPADQAQQLELLVKQSGVTSMKDARVANARDVHIYSIEVIDSEVNHKVTFDQLSLPQAVRPLLEFLNTHAKSLLPDD